MTFMHGMTANRTVLLTALVLLLSTLSWAKKDSDSKAQPDVVKRLHNASEVLSEIMAAPDKGIPGDVLRDAKCVVVVPSMVKFAVGIGGHYGKGFATCRTASSWSAPAPVLLTGGSWGLQFGGQAVDLVMLVMNQKGVDHLLSSKFAIGADASAAAGPVGRQAAAGTDWKMKAEILTYSRARGVFAGVDLTGSVIKQDKDETAVLYGKILPFQDILSGKVAPPQPAQEFLATLEKYASATTQQGNLQKPNLMTTARWAVSRPL